MESGESVSFEVPMKVRHWIICGVLLLFGGCMYEFLGGLRTHVFHGQVVNFKTGKPLAGAVVTVIWGTSSFGYEAGPFEFLTAQEAVADANGNFTLQASSGLNWRPFSLASDPQIIVFQPGYEPLVERNFAQHGYANTDLLVRALKSGVTISLRKLDDYEIGRHVDSPISTPYERIPNLMHAINKQRSLAGMGAIPPKSLQKGSR